jgi:hypothetical protein
MKNYLVFIGLYYYPNGGMEDFIEDFDTLDEAKNISKIGQTMNHIQKLNIGITFIQTKIRQ